MQERYSDLDVSPRLLMGPGPSGVDARVLRLMATSLVGHLDPDFLKVMKETRDLRSSSSRPATNSPPR